MSKSKKKKKKVARAKEFAGEVIQTEFLNRELSWLEFNRRVLQEALDARTPLLERLRFLTIFTSNLDEFFMKRVGGLKRQLEAGVLVRTPDGMNPAEQLLAIRERVAPMLDQQAKCFINLVESELPANGIFLLRWEDLNAEEREQADAYYRKSVFPILTPLAVDPGHPFPFLSNLSRSLGVTVSYPDRDDKLFTRVKIPTALPQWVRLGADRTKTSFRFVRLHEIISNNVEALFPNMVIRNKMLFRVTRNADVERDEDVADDLLELMEEEVRRRRFADVVRLEHTPNYDPWMLRFLLQELELSEEDVYELSSELDYSTLRAISELQLPKLQYEPWVPVVPPAFCDEDTSIFSVLEDRDVLVHHPFESFSSSVEKLLRAAVDDPKVLAIKMTVYRTGQGSTVIPLLMRAAAMGKQVACLVEVKARFEEERNIQWAQELEKSGVHVVYGIVGLKTHAKLLLIIRQEADGLRSFAHIGTGNYHSQTAQHYTDVGLFTSKPDFVDDLVDLFHFLTGRSLKRNYRKLLVAPINLRSRFLDMIEREISNQAKGIPSGIIAKMNSFDEHSICTALYRASGSGVPISLIVRGFCCLRPGVVGLSENIKVISIIGRFLEHARIFYFRNGAEDPIDGEFYIGSADWMYRNLSGRVEVVTPVEDRSLRERLWEILQLSLDDRRQAWEMASDGSYLQRQPVEVTEDIGSQQQLMKLARSRTALAGIYAE